MTNLNDSKILLTGIKPTGTPHIGNYLGTIKPSLELSQKHQTFFFIADYHALNAVKHPDKIRNDTYEVTAAWMACGLDLEKVIFYRQSKIPQISELAVILSNVTSKGLMNRGHAYKAMVQDNLSHERDPDKAVNMGLYNYPLLMSADILMFQTDLVPVGKDQVQHVEIARDIAESFNRTYQVEAINYPQAIVDEQVATVPGVDGRKMSKSYNNVIPLFAEEKILKKAVMKIETDSQTVEAVKNPNTCRIYEIYQYFSSPIEQSELKKKYLAGGMGWGEAKLILLEKLDRFFKPMRDRYRVIKEDRAYLEKQLERGEEKARMIANQNLNKIKKIIGIA